jgi:hypothetical protein
MEKAPGAGWLLVACASGFAMIVYAVYHAYYAGGAASVDRLLVRVGAGLFILSIYFLIKRGSHIDRGQH